MLELGADPHLMNDAGQTAAQSLLEEHPEISEFLCTLTGETLPTTTTTGPRNDDGNQGNTSTTGMDASTAMSIVDTLNAQPPADIDSLDPLSRQAAIETNNRAGNLLARVQEILIECDESGEDPEPRIRAIVDETVRNTMEAGRQLAEMQVETGGGGGGVEEANTMDAQAGTIEQSAASADASSADKRQRREDDAEQPGR